MAKAFSYLRNIRENGIEETFYNYLYSVYSPHKKTYSVRVKSPKGPLKSPFEHAVDAAKNIGTKAVSLSKPVYLCMSGGSDSEAMAQAFLVAKVPFEVRIAAFKGGLNRFDIEEVIRFCEHKKLSYQIVPIDLKSHFRRRQPFRYALLNGCQSPQFSVYMDLASLVGGYPVFGGNPPSLDWDPNHSNFKIYVPRLKEWPLQRHLDLMGGGIAFFFSSTPELTYSFLHATAFRRCIEEKRSLRYLDKIRVYNGSGFSILPREKKYGGFERVKKIYAMRYSHLFHYCYDNTLRWNLDIIGPDLQSQVCILEKKYLPEILGGTYKLQSPQHV